MAELRSHFRPEFLNRVDDIVLFKPLTLSTRSSRSSTSRSLDLGRQSRTRSGYDCSEITEAARVLHRPGPDTTRSTVHGPLKRYLQHELETRVSAEPSWAARVEAGIDASDIDMSPTATCVSTSFPSTAAAGCE